MTSPNPMALEAKALEAVADRVSDLFNAAKSGERNLMVSAQKRRSLGDEAIHSYAWDQLIKLHEAVGDAIRAYVAALPPPAAGEGLEPVAVKPLEWDDSVNALTPFGTYMVREAEFGGDGYQWTFRPYPFDVADEKVYRRIGQAIEAAQADYDQRIRPDISPTPAARAAVLEAALREADRLLADLRQGTFIHNERTPGKRVEGPLWEQIPDVRQRIEAALKEKT